MSIAVVGTSIEHGTWLDRPDQAWPQRLAARIGQPIIDRSLPGGAWTAPNEVGETIRSELDAALEELRPTTVLVGGVPNDLVRTDDVGSICWAVQHAIGACAAAGVTRVVLMGTFPVNDGGALAAGWWQNIERRRTTYNAWAAEAGRVEGPLVTYAGDLATLLCSPGAWRADPRWFSDGLHPNRYGTALIAEGFPVEQVPQVSGATS